MKTGLSITLAAVPDREFEVAEIWLVDEMVAEVHRENGLIELQIYRRPNDEPWEFPLEDFLRILEQAKERLEEGIQR